MNLLDLLMNYTDVNFYEIYGLRRSGNHAIIAWLMNNLNSEIIDYKEPIPLIAPMPSEGFISQYLGDVIHINDVSSNWGIKGGNYIKGLIDAYVSIGMKSVIVSYEDTPYTHSFSNIDNYACLKDSTKIIISRDIRNIVASRIKKNKLGCVVNNHIIDVWLKNENSPENINIIRYENWLTSKDYRDNISNKLGLTNRDVTHIVSAAGAGSSFKDQSTGTINKDILLNRYKTIEFSPDVESMLSRTDVEEKLKKLNYK